MCDYSSHMQTELKWRESAAEYLAMAEQARDSRVRERCLLLAAHCLEMAEELACAPAHAGGKHRDD